MEIEIATLMDTFEKKKISELEVETDGVRIYMKKEKNEEYAEQKYEEEKCRPLLKENPKETVKTEKTMETSSNAEVKAPFVGTFYRAAKPQDAPYIKEGQTIKKGDVIGLVEAMKMMNEIEAPFDGIVKKILVQDGAFVEYDQVLVEVEEQPHV